MVLLLQRSLREKRKKNTKKKPLILGGAMANIHVRESSYITQSTQLQCQDGLVLQYYFRVCVCVCVFLERKFVSKIELLGFSLYCESGLRFIYTVRFNLPLGVVQKNKMLVYLYIKNVDNFIKIVRNLNYCKIKYIDDLHLEIIYINNSE